MPTMTPEEAIEKLKSLPEDKQRLVLGKLDPSVRKGILDNLKVQNIGLNPDKQGTYHMKDKKGNSLYVPYGHVNAAAKAGFTMTDDDRVRYVKDAAADTDKTDNIPTARPSPADVIESAKENRPINTSKASDKAPEGVSVAGRNSAGEPIFAPTDPNADKGFGSYLQDTGEVLANAGKGLVSLFNPNPTEEEKARGETRPIDDFLRIPKRALIDPSVAQSDEAYQDIKGGKTVEGLGHELAATVPFVGPWAAQVGESYGQHLGSGDISAANADITGNAILYAAPHIVGSVLSGLTKIPKVPRSLAEKVTDTTPREVRYAADEAVKANKDAVKAAAEKDIENAKDYEEKKANADKEQQGKEIKHAYDEKMAQEKAEKETQEANEKEREKVNAANLKQLKDEGEARLKALQKNKENIQNYNEEFKKTKAENEANYRREVQRQKLEKDYKTGSQRLIEKTKQIYKKATGDYNASWNKWREMIKGQVADMTPVVDAIKKQEQGMDPTTQTQFRQILRETTPADGDLSELQKTRDDIARQNKLGSNYDSLNPTSKQAVDEIINRLNLNDIEEGGADIKSVPAERLHTWKSQLEKAVRTEKDGPTRHAIGKVLGAVRQLETDVSAQVPGADKQLAASRAITGPYFDAFFKSPEEVPRATGQMLREQTPEEVKEQAAQDRLNRIAAYDPSLASLAKHVDNLQQALKNIPKPKELKQLPVKPAPVPTPKPGQLQEFTPKETPKVELPKPERNEPTKPKPVEPKTKQISPEDYKERKIEHIKKASRELRSIGLRRAIYATLTASAFPVIEAFRGASGEQVGAAALGGIFAGGVVLYGSHAIAELVDRPAVTAWLAKVTPRDIAEFNKLPPEDKAVFTDDMRAMVDAAEKKGYPVSPELKKFAAKGKVPTAAASATRNQTLQQLKDEALRRNPNAIRVKAPDGSIHVFPNQQAADNFKKEAGIR